MDFSLKLHLSSTFVLYELLERNNRVGGRTPSLFRHLPIPFSINRSRLLGDLGQCPWRAWEMLFERISNYTFRAPTQTQCTLVGAFNSAAKSKLGDRWLGRDLMPVFHNNTHSLILYYVPRFEPFPTDKPQQKWWRRWTDKVLYKPEDHHYPVFAGIGINLVLIWTNKRLPSKTLSAFYLYYVVHLDGVQW